MAIARHESGPRADLGALASQVHPVFMLPPLAATLFGGFLAGGFSFHLAIIHGATVFFGLYTAHVKDGYVDFFVRDEDGDHPLTERGCRIILVVSSLAFFVCIVVLTLLVDLGAALLSLPGWFIGYFHAPQLDMNPVTASVGYPTGIALAHVGGYYVQTSTLSPVVVALALVFLIILTGIKVIDDSKDVEYDRSIGKRTVAVVLTVPRARRVAYGLMATGMAVVLVLTVVVDGIPPTAAVASIAFGGVAVLSRRREPEIATMLLIRGSYLFLAVLLAGIWFRPLG